MTRLIWIAALLGTLSALAYATIALWPREPPPAHAIARDPGAARRSIEDTVPQGSIGRLTTPVSRPRAIGPGPIDDAAAHSPPSEAAAPQGPRAEARARAAGLLQRFEAEADDAAWSRPTERAIAAAVASELLTGVHVRQASCRSTMCRVEFQLDDAEAVERLQSNLPALLPSNTNGVFLRIDGDGAQRQLLYLARPGHVI